MVDIEDIEDVEGAVEDVDDIEEAIEAGEDLTGNEIDFILKRGLKFFSNLEKSKAVEDKRAQKEQREAEAHTAVMERERLRIAKLQKEIAALDEKKAVAQSSIPGLVTVPNSPSVLYGELPSLPQAPNLMCETNPEEFKAFLDYIAKNPISIVILGSKGYGKSALGHALLEYLHFSTGRNAVLYAPLTIKKSILPNWLCLVDTWDNIPDNALVLVDEAALMLNSRNPGSRANRGFTELNAISRQKNLGLIFVSQSSRSLDINALMAGDVEIIYKKPPTFAGLNERKEVKDMSKIAKKLLDKLDDAVIREYSVIFASSGEVMLMKSGLSSYWNNEVSTMYKDCVGITSQQDQVKNNSKKDEILRLSSQGVTQQEIAQKLGISQAYVSMIISRRK